MREADQTHQTRPERNRSKVLERRYRAQRRANQIVHKTSAIVAAAVFERLVD
jgi:hypothetical protein